MTAGSESLDDDKDRCSLAALTGALFPPLSVHLTLVVTRLSPTLSFCSLAEVSLSPTPLVLSNPLIATCTRREDGLSHRA